MFDVEFVDVSHCVILGLYGVFCKLALFPKFNSISGSVRVLCHTVVYTRQTVYIDSDVLIP
jgi:hypothetical protein